jgi:peptide/nickel transport system permease protein
MLDVIKKDYVKTARAKGVGELTIIVKHALRNAMIPVVTVIGTQTGYLLGGAVLTESTFSWPGLGRLAVDAVMKRDFPLIQGTVLFLAAVFVVVNLLVDVSYAFLDPRIRYD